MNAFGRILLWLCCVFLSAALFSLYFGLEGFRILFRLTIIFALPVSLLYLPVVIALRDAKHPRNWTHLVSAALIGPICLAVWGALRMRGRDAHTLWLGDGLDFGIVQMMFFACIVGFLTALLYVIGLRSIGRNSIRHRTS